MGDYMFMLESHLSAGQYRVVGQMRELAGEAAVPVFLTGGAMRDTLGGFPATIGTSHAFGSRSGRPGWCNDRSSSH